MDAKFATGKIRVTCQEAKRKAEQNQICKIKAVGCSIIEFYDRNSTWQCYGINGPGHPANECTGERGKCGCMHSEPRALLKYLQKEKQGPAVLTTTYSSCDPCANLVVASGVIDLVVYEIFEPVWPRGNEILGRVIPVWQLEEVTEGRVDEWLTNHGL